MTRLSTNYGSINFYYYYQILSLMFLYNGVWKYYSRDLKEKKSEPLMFGALQKILKQENFLRKIL